MVTYDVRNLGPGIERWSPVSVGEAICPFLRTGEHDERRAGLGECITLAERVNRLVEVCPILLHTSPARASSLVLLVTNN